MLHGARPDEAVSARGPIVPLVAICFSSFSPEHKYRFFFFVILHSA